jgi:hypothetical protein
MHTYTHTAPLSLSLSLSLSSLTSLGSVVSLALSAASCSSNEAIAASSSFDSCAPAARLPCSSACRPLSAARSASSSWLLNRLGLG